jgi:hypothetical protein
MAQLNPSNIQNGNVIQANDVLNLYDALTSGGGYDVSISGSLTGSATTSDTTLSSNVFFYGLLENGSTNFRPIIGISNPLSDGSVVVDISDLAPPPTQLGIDIFITASPSGSCTNPIEINFGGGNLIFTTQDVGSTARVLFTGWII